MARMSFSYLVDNDDLSLDELTEKVMQEDVSFLTYTLIKNYLFQSSIINLCIIAYPVMERQIFFTQA